MFAVVLLDSAASDNLNWVTYSAGDEGVASRRGVSVQFLPYNE